MITTKVFLLVTCVALASTLTGCHECEEPTPQLEYRPDTGVMNNRADRYDVNGLWRGNGNMIGPPGELEVEQYSCTKVHEGDVGMESYCESWTARESNCGEIDFGVCNCTKVSTSGNYCAAWSCELFEADQHICEWVEGDDDVSKVCWYDHMDIDITKYEAIKQHNAASGKAFVVYKGGWWTAFSTSVLCIVHGDFLGTHHQQQAQQLRYCNGNHYFREVETEISACWCSQGSPDEKFCAKWHCEEKDTGLFKILYEAPIEIKTLVTGIETEYYTCIENTGHKCTAWDGDIRSPEEIEMSRCKCLDQVCMKWMCDEWEIPVMHGWYYSPWAYFLPFVMIGVACGIAGCIGDDEVRMCLPCGICLGLVISALQFYWLGVWGWIFSSLPFLCCQCLPLGLLATQKGGAKARSLQAEVGDSSSPEDASGESE